MRRHLLNASTTALGLASLTGGGASAGSSHTTPSSTGFPVITIVGQNGTQAFTPNPASFGGQQVVFKSNDSVTHRVMLNDSSIDTGDIALAATRPHHTIPPG